MTLNVPVYQADDFPFDQIRPESCGRRKRWQKRRNAAQIAAFDIETTGYIYKGEERRAMYHWQFSYNNEAVALGRTAGELRRFFSRLSDALPNNDLTICVHNLSYEFNFCYQFLEAVFGPATCFFLDTRRIARMQFENLNFIDTFILCPMSLERISLDYDLHYKKAAGDLDHNVRRNASTIMTGEETGYCILDVLSLVEYYKTEMRLRGYDPSNMPMTKTALVRYPLRRASRFAVHNGLRYPDYILQIQNGYEVFLLLEECFQGGYTAVNAGYRNRTVYGDIRCRDFTSSYPAWMLGVAGCYFPMSVYSLLAEELDLSDPGDHDLFIKVLRSKCCLFVAEFTNLRLKPGRVSPIISASKCRILEDECRLNGKVAFASRLRKVVNEVELEDILTFYDCDTLGVENVYIADRGDLPEFIREMIRKLFRDKTQLKGMEGKELEYMLAKADLNSIYGMMAMNPIREKMTLDPGEMRGSSSVMTPEEREKAYNKNVKSRNNFLNYAWSLYVTTWARHYLFQAMEICGESWLYSDTDSVYYLSTPEIELHFKEFNDRITSVSFQAKNEKTGKVSTLGEMTPDGSYEAFRGLGAKKYALLTKEGKIKLTVAGVPKNQPAADTVKTMDDFKAGHLFAGSVTGKLRPEYHPAPIRIENVNGLDQETASYINLFPCDYILADSRFDDFVTIM